MSEDNINDSAITIDTDDELTNKGIIFDKPIVVVSVGHRWNDQGADTITLSPEIIANLKNKVTINSNGTVSEFQLYRYIAVKIREIINTKSDTVRCMCANRLSNISEHTFFPSDEFICGNSNGASGAPIAVKQWNNSKGNNKVCAFIELHFDSPGGGVRDRRGFIWCSDYPVTRKLSDNTIVKIKNEGTRLGCLIRKALKKAIPGWTPNPSRVSSMYGFGVASDSDYRIIKNGNSIGSKQNRGAKLWTALRGTDIVSCLVEVFNGDSKEDTFNTLSNIDKLCEELASSLIEYASGKALKISEEELLKIMNSGTYSVGNNFSEDQKKDIALKTQQKLRHIEQQMGVGGDSYHVALRNSTEIIGTSPNITKPFRSGRTTSYKMPSLKAGGIVDDEKLIPSVEKVIRDYPTGNKFIHANGQYNITSGELNLVSQGNALIKTPSILELEGGPQISFTCSDNMTINCSNAIISSTMTSITGNTSINGNVSINGGVLASGSAYFDGGVSAPEFNGPYEIDNTNAHALYGYIDGTVKLKVKSAINGINIIGGQVFDLEIVSVESGSEGEMGKPLIKIPPHKHQFKRLKGALASNIVEIQESVASSVNS